MFYFKITVKRKREIVPRIAYHEFTKPSYAGEYIAARLTNPAVKSATVEKISQSDYIAATRSKD